MGAAAGPDIIEDGLVLCLDAAERQSYAGSGTVWRDLAGSNNGALINAPTFRSANRGSIVFDGVNDRVTITNPLLSSTGNWTISFWSIFFTLNANVSNETAGSLYSQYIAAAGNGRTIFRIKNNGTIINKLDLFLGSGSTYSNQSITGATTIITNTFYNLVATRNGNIFTMYINGNLETSSTLIGININVLQSIPEIGGINSGNFGWLNGGIAQTLIHNRALTPTEIQQNYNATKSRYVFPAYDADAVDYFSRAEALGGSFDQTGIDATYTESYVKTAISDMIVGLKADGVWSEITELYLMSAVTFGGLMAKVKHAGTATLTQINFVAADYIAAGAGAGLKGNGNKTLATTKTHGALGSMGIYRTVKETSGSAFIGDDDGAGGNRFFIDGNGAGGATRYYYGKGVAVSGNTDNGFLAVSRTSSTSLRAYRNTVVAGSNGSAITPVANTGALAGLFCVIYSNNNSRQGRTTARMSFAYFAQPLDDTQALNLSARVNTLMTALGCNVF